MVTRALTCHQNPKLQHQQVQTTTRMRTRPFPQVIGAAIIGAWSLAWSSLVFGLLRWAGLLRVDAHEEAMGGFTHTWLCARAALLPLCLLRSWIKGGSFRVVHINLRHMCAGV